MSEFTELLKSQGWWEESPRDATRFSDLVQRTWVELADTYDPKQLDRVIGPVVYWINHYCPQHLRGGVIPSISRLYIIQQMLSGNTTFTTTMLTKYADQVPVSSWQDVQRVVGHIVSILRGIEESGALDGRPSTAC
jgi:hypothetical protein